MAKNDNLQDFLTDVANAIRNKKGTSDLINPQDFSNEIESIESNSFNAELFYGFWQLKKDNQTYVLKIYDTGKLDYEIYNSSPTKYTDISYTITNDTIEFQFVSGGSNDNIEITVKTFKYENDTLIDINTNDIYSHILFSDGTLSVTENGTYGPAESNGFNMVEVNVQGGDYDIDVVDNDDGTQSLYITDSDSSIDRNATIKGLVERTLTTFEIPSYVTSIGNYAFYNFNSLTGILTIPDGVTSIGNNAFYGCNKLTKITIPEGVISIGNSAFGYCKSLTSITIPNSVTSIGSAAFQSCENIGKLYYNGDIKKWAELDHNGYVEQLYSLYIDNQLINELIIPNDVTKIGKFAFAHSNISKVTFESGSQCKNIGIDAFYYSPMTSIVFEGDFNGTSIEQTAFFYCTNLSNITLPEGVTSIGTMGFAQCSSLTDVVLPSTIRSLSNQAFSHCGKLKNVTILATTPPTLSNTDVFYNAYALSKIYIPNGTLNAYKTATNWSSFASKFVELEA